MRPIYNLKRTESDRACVYVVCVCSNDPTQDGCPLWQVWYVVPFVYLRTFGTYDVRLKRTPYVLAHITRDLTYCNCTKCVEYMLLSLLEAVDVANEEE